MRLLLGLIILSLCGCTSTLYKGSCGTLTSNKNTVPYTMGTASGTATGCYMACVGDCKNEDFSPIQKVLTDYIKDAPKENTIQTVDGGLVTYTPSRK